ncbi:MAG: M50 family metallopeptidase [Actinomycetota bacterium]|nr:M50 family metallopeptidase [Actinomycetota bacterium]
MLIPEAVWDAVGSAGTYRLSGRALSRNWLAIVALAMAVGAMVPGRAWRTGRLIVTAVHEGGHAVAAVLVGRKVSAVHLRANSSGVTFHSGPAGRVRCLVTAAAGYPAPGLVGLIGAFAIARGHPDLWLVGLLVLAAVNLVLWVRNLFGMLMMVLGVAGLVWLVLNGSAGAQALAGMVGVWYLAIGGLRASLELRGHAQASDAREVGRLLHLPVALCKAGFVLSAAAAAVVVAGFLLAGW